jgi:crossover junction endodeoxyribonuclease RusA
MYRHSETGLPMAGLRGVVSPQYKDGICSGKLGEEMSACISVSLPWPESALSPNSRDRWAKIAAAKSARYIAKLETFKLFTIGANDKPVYNFFVRLKISFIFHPPTHRHYDLDGLVTRCKNYQDGIFDALNNNDNQIEVIEARIKDVCAGGSVTITISEVDE